MPRTTLTAPGPNPLAWPLLGVRLLAAARARTAAAADLGLNRLGLFFIALNAVVLAIDIALFTSSGLSIDWSTVVLNVLPLGAFALVWLNFYLVPGRPRERFAAEVVFVIGLLVVFTNLGSLMQYGAVALGFPYIDPWLAAADKAMGIHVPALAAWTTAHPITQWILVLSYFSLMPQVFLVFVIIAAHRDRARLWELAFHLQVCLFATVAALIVCPAICPPAYYHFSPSVDMTRLIHQIQTLHQGTLTIVRFDELEGLVSFPSFHVAGALIVTWAVRRRRRWLVPIACLNLVLIASTILTGVHYFVDVLAAGPLFIGSVVLYRRYGQPLLELPGRRE